MTETNDIENPPHVDEVDAKTGETSSKFWYMFTISTALIVTAMIITFGFFVR